MSMELDIGPPAPAARPTIGTEIRRPWPPRPSRRRVADNPAPLALAAGTVGWTARDGGTVAEAVGDPIPMTPNPPDYIKVVRHLGKVYTVVFNDFTFNEAREVWERQGGPAAPWKCVWSHLWAHKGLSPSQRTKNVAAKAMADHWNNLGTTSAPVSSSLMNGIKEPDAGDTKEG